MAALTMSNAFAPPLALHFIWHPSDQESVQPILDAVRSYFARDIDRPFSRGLNIPLFFYSSESPKMPPTNHLEQMAARDIIVVFTSVNTLGWKEWQGYIDQLPLSSTFPAIPVAINREGLGHGEDGRLKNLNFLRAYQWQGETRIQQALLSMAHEIYRHGLVEIKKDDHGKNSSIKLFLSHAKAGDTGRLHAEAIYRYIDNTNMSRFFDATEIAPGFKFDKEIITHIKDSTLIAIGSDAYSSRYWCQREILCAKQYQRPILAVDCLEEFEDRVFPAGSNVPCVHVSADANLSERDILRILIATLLETIRHTHAQKILAYYQSQEWIPSDCAIISRPPELRQVIDITKNGQTSVCYPEPSVYMEESDWLCHFDVEAFTPLWNKNEDKVLENKRIGISVSEFPANGYASHHLHPDHLKRLSQDLARHVLARAGTLIYGGDLRKDGFTQFILDEAIALKSRLNSNSIYIENHLAWPLYVSAPEIVAWRAKYNGIIKTVEHDIPDDIANQVDKNTALAPSNEENKYVWSRCLTQMRQQSIQSSDARICAGGKLSGFLGKMPGVLEEIVLALEQNKPLYLLGGFGGVVREVCQSITHKSVTEPLTESWQIHHTEGYQALQDKARHTGHHSNYAVIEATLESIDLEQLAQNAGLELNEYRHLMTSPFIDECVHIILKGLKTISTS